MKNTEIIEMINNGEIEQLKAILGDEIYTENLAVTTDGKKRYAAMKRYFKFAGKKSPLTLRMPCKGIVVNGETYNCFADGFTFVLTKEPIGEMQAYDNSNHTYFDMQKYVNLACAESVRRLDLRQLLAQAKSMGYRYKKSEVGRSADYQYLFKYKGTYFKMGLLDKTFSIIDDGSQAEVYYTGAKSFLYMKTSVGIAGILPTIVDPERKVEEKVHVWQV